MGFLLDFLGKLSFAFAFILINTIIIIIIGIFIIHLRKDVKLDEDKKLIIPSLDKVINFRDIIISVFGFGMIVYLIFQIFIFIKNFTVISGM